MSDDSILAYWIQHSAAAAALCGMLVLGCLVAVSGGGGHIRHTILHTLPLCQSIMACSAPWCRWKGEVDAQRLRYIGREGGIQFVSVLKVSLEQHLDRNTSIDRFLILIAL